MKKTINILIIISIVFIFFSCEKKEDFLDKPPLGEYSETVVWKDAGLAKTFVNNIYKGVFGNPFSAMRISDFVDESHFAPDWGMSAYNKGLITPDDYCTWDWSWQTAYFTWESLYSTVRQTNIFMSNVNSIDTLRHQKDVKYMKGEVYFLRAAAYHNLTTLYGGVPIITKAYLLSDEFKVPRNTYADCIDFIVHQLDSAVMLLPETNEVGRITKSAALAFKSKVLVYAASDLHNPSKNGAVTNGYANPEYIGYTTNDAVARWTAAKLATKAVIELNKYGLYKATPAATDSVAVNFTELFSAKSATNEDIIMVVVTPKTLLGGWAEPSIASFPNGYHGCGLQAPIEDLVEDYEMKDGSKFNWNNPVQKVNPYNNRDARFYATVLYEGVQWSKRTDDGLIYDPLSKIQVGYVYNTSGEIIKPGLDTRKGPIEDWNGSYCGYYLRKGIDETVTPKGGVAPDLPSRYMRYAEVILNYAEACIELGQDAEARIYINMIRTRAGQPNLSATLNGDALRQAYRHERRIELSFENHRFWDVRRWMIGSQAYHQTSAMLVKYVTTNATVDKYRQADGSTWGMPDFSKIDIPGDARAWNNKMYFFPIKRGEMNKNDKLVQNPGY